MATIPTNYPSGCTDEQISLSISELSKEILDSGGDINIVLRFSPIISLGQTELQKRILERNQAITVSLQTEVKRLAEITEKNIASSEKFSKSSIRISIVALFISMLAVGISIYFSIQSNQETKEWRQDEINLLQKILAK